MLVMYCSQCGLPIYTHEILETLIFYALRIIFSSPGGMWMWWCIASCIIRAAFVTQPYQCASCVRLYPYAVYRIKAFCECAAIFNSFCSFRIPVIYAILRDIQGVFFYITSTRDLKFFIMLNFTLQHFVWIFLRFENCTCLRMASMGNLMRNAWGSWRWRWLGRWGKMKRPPDGESPVSVCVYLWGDDASCSFAACRRGWSCPRAWMSEERNGFSLRICNCKLSELLFDAWSQTTSSE